MADLVSRQIRNSAGTVIGSLSLPSDTTEEQWAQALSNFLYDPSNPTLSKLNAMIKLAVANAVIARFGQLIDQMSAGISAGIIEKGFVSLGEIPE